MSRVSDTNLLPINEEFEPIGERLARLRKERGYTQKELAQKISIKQALISKYEKEKLRLSAEMLLRFSEALKVSADDILGLRPNKKERRPSPSLRILKRVQKIEKLPPSQQKAILKTLDLALQNVQNK